MLIEPHQRRDRYLVASGAAAIAVLLRWTLDPVLGHTSFYVTVYASALLTSLLCGVGAAALCTILSMLGVVYWFVDPRQSLAIIGSRDMQSIVACAATCVVLIWLGNSNRNQRLRLEAGRAELDARVKQRTEQLSVAFDKVTTEAAQREKAEQALRRLSLRLMTVQDEDRRRISRELHDSVGQLLAAMKMDIAILRRVTDTLPDATAPLQDLTALIDETLRDIRTMSHVLHPPSLDEAGFGSAAKWFLDGFGQRSGLQVECDLPGHVPRMPSNVELVLFRALQESLTNVHRHSGATAVSIKCEVGDREVMLWIKDNGHGFERELDGVSDFDPNGMGLAGMLERVRELGGNLDCESNDAGTCIRVHLPLAINFAASF